MNSYLPESFTTGLALTSGPSPDVLREVLLPKLDELTRGFFGITAGACWQVLKDAGLTCKLDSNQLSVRAAGEGYLRYLIFAIYEGKPRVRCRALQLRGQATWIA